MRETFINEDGEDIICKDEFTEEEKKELMHAGASIMEFARYLEMTNSAYVWESEGNVTHVFTAPIVKKMACDLLRLKWTGGKIVPLDIEE